jgi:hypothetical protein
MGVGKTVYKGEAEFAGFDRAAWRDASLEMGERSET